MIVGQQALTVMTALENFSSACLTAPGFGEHFMPSFDLGTHNGYATRCSDHFPREDSDQCRTRIRPLHLKELEENRHSQPGFFTVCLHRRLQVADMCREKPSGQHNMT